MKLIDHINIFVQRVFGEIPPAPVVKEKGCTHDWVDAGPKKRLADILHGIEGIRIEWANDNKTRMEIFIGTTKQMKYQGMRHMLVSDEWYNALYQGQVCLNCGECKDRIAEMTKDWTDKVHKANQEQIAKLEREVLAERMWNDCKG